MERSSRPPGQMPVSSNTRSTSVTFTNSLRIGSNQLRFLVGHFDSPVTASDQRSSAGGLGTVHCWRCPSRFPPHGISFRWHRFRHLRQRKASNQFRHRCPRHQSPWARRLHQPLRYLHFRQHSRLHRTHAGCNDITHCRQGSGHVRILEKSGLVFVEDNIRLKPNFSLYLGVRYYCQNYFQ